MAEEKLISIIRKQVKQRQESIELYRKGNRDDLAEKETKEIDILSNYLPQEIEGEELEKIVDQTIEKLKASTPADFGRVIKQVMDKTKGRARGKQVADLVKKALSG